MKNGHLILPLECYKKITAHIRIELPNEACGILSGSNGHVTKVWPLDNQSQSCHRFFVDKKIVNKTYEQIEKMQEQVIAIYHSHPTSLPNPSFLDIKHHVSDEVLMMIISLKYKKPLMKCYQIKENDYEEYPFLIKTLS